MDSVELPGGLIREGKLCRKFNFQPVDGRLELAIAEANRNASNMPDAVTMLLQTALTDEAGQSLDEKSLSGMSVGDRQFLVYRLAGLIDDSPRWMSVRCGSCSEQFDISYRFSDVPVKLPGKGFPRKTVETDTGNWTVRVPTGRDQSKLAAIESHEEAERALLRRLVTAPPGKSIEDLDESEAAKIESAIESISPELADSTSAVCPECNHENRAPLDPWPLVNHSSRILLTEVHNLAIHYHWSEAEILSLPRERRRYYLRLIYQARGMLREGAREK